MQGGPKRNRRCGHSFASCACFSLYAYVLPEAGAALSGRARFRTSRQKAILKAVDSLPRKMRQVVILFEFEELTYEQISKKIGQPVGTVKSRLFNARKILTEKLNYLRGE